MKKAYKPTVVNRPLRERLRPIAEFTQAEASSGVFLMICAVVALVWANSPWAKSYFDTWQTTVTVAIGQFRIEKPLLLWINDGLMAVFFFVVGLEIKREILIGELSSLRKASLPIVAAIGGMVVPALIYAGFNIGMPSLHGWGIPMATDIAFALGVLTLLGSRVPFALKVFLTAVAIVDDIGAVLVIAFFYSGTLDWNMLAAAAVVLAFLFVLNNQGVRAPLWYILPGILLWVFFLKSGVHATIAGVLLAATIPTKVYLDPLAFKAHATDALDAFVQCGEETSHELMTEDRQTAVRELEKACERVQMPMERIEDALHPWVGYFIMPVFALANAGVSVSEGVGAALSGSIGLGVLLGLVLGKPIGITLFCWLAVKTGLAKLPSRVGWRQMIGVGMLAGIGFTMSLFIAELAFSEPDRIAQAKIAILTASVLAGVIGFLMLRKASRLRTRPATEPESKKPTTNRPSASQ